MDSNLGFSKCDSERETRSSYVNTSWFSMQNWRYSDWWNRFSPIPQEELLDLMTACYHGSRQLLVNAGQRKAVSDCTTWFARGLITISWEDKCSRATATEWKSNFETVREDSGLLEYFIYFDNIQLGSSKSFRAMCVVQIYTMATYLT